MTLPPRTYKPLDAFRYNDNGRVYVYLNEPGHRLPEEFVPAAEVARLRFALESIAALKDTPGSDTIRFHALRIAREALEAGER